jgi:hypothetical protein
LRWKWREYSTIAVTAEIAGIAAIGADDAAFVTISTVQKRTSTHHANGPF